MEQRHHDYLGQFMGALCLLVLMGAVALGVFKTADYLLTPMVDAWLGPKHALEPGQASDSPVHVENQAESYVVTVNAFGVVTFCWPAEVLTREVLQPSIGGAWLSNGVVLSAPWLAGVADQLGIDPAACPGGRYLRH